MCVGYRKGIRNEKQARKLPGRQSLDKDHPENRNSQSCGTVQGQYKRVILSFYFLKYIFYGSANSVLLLRSLSSHISFYKGTGKQQLIKTYKVQVHNSWLKPL